QHLAWKKEKCTEARLISKASTRLGKLRAVRFVMAYEESGEPMIEDEIVALRSQLAEEHDIIYTIGLTTPASRYNQDKRLVLEIQRSWVFDPLPDDYPLPPVYEESDP